MGFRIDLKWENLVEWYDVAKCPPCCSEIPSALDVSCLSPVKNLIETSLASSHPSACSIALSAYASIITEGDNHLSPLRDVFPTIIAVRDELAVTRLRTHVYYSNKISLSMFLEQNCRSIKSSNLYHTGSGQCLVAGSAIWHGL